MCHKMCQIHVPCVMWAQLCVASCWDTERQRIVMGIPKIKASPLSGAPILEYKLTYGHTRQNFRLIGYWNMAQVSATSISLEGLVCIKGLFVPHSIGYGTAISFVPHLLWDSHLGQLGHPSLLIRLIGVLHIWQTCCDLFFHCFYITSPFSSQKVCYLKATQKRLTKLQN